MHFSQSRSAKQESLEALLHGMDGMVPGMVGTTGEHGLLLPLLSLNPPTGGRTPGEDGTHSGRDGIQLGDGIPHGEQDPLDGDGETGTSTAGTDPPSPPQEQESLFLNLLKYLYKSFVFSFRRVHSR